MRRLSGRIVIVVISLALPAGANPASGQSNPPRTLADLNETESIKQ